MDIISRIEERNSKLKRKNHDKMNKYKDFHYWFLLVDVLFLLSQIIIYAIVVAVNIDNPKYKYTFDYDSAFDYTITISTSIFILSILVFNTIMIYFRIKRTINVKKYYKGLLRTMSHDIKSPMNAIIGLVHLSKDAMDDKHKLLEYLNKIESSSNSTLKLVNHLLDLTRHSCTKIVRSKFSLIDLLNEIYAVISPLAIQKNIDFRIVLTRIQTEFFNTDFLKVYEILVNLLTNAVKYTNEGGYVCLLIKELYLEENEKKQIFACYEFVVKDNGIGMDNKCIRQLYKPFKRGKNGMNREGHGLGMSIVGMLIDIFQGDLTVHSVVGRGTEFFLWLPMFIEDYKKNFYYEDFKFPCLNVLFLDEDELNNDYLENAFSDLKMNVKFNCDIKNVERFSFVFADLYYLSDEKKVLLDKANELKIPIFICSNNITEEIKKYDVQGITSKPLTRYKIYELLQGLDESDIKNHLVEEKEKLNILICDDTLINLEVLYSLLIKNNYNVHKVMDSNEALKMFENSSEGYYSAVITDKVMPNLDGFELTQAIRNLNRKDNNVAIILTSADYTKEDLIKGKEVKVDAYIDKPVFIDNLLLVLNQMIKKR